MKEKLLTAALAVNIYADTCRSNSLFGPDPVYASIRYPSGITNQYIFGPVVKTKGQRLRVETYSVVLIDDSCKVSDIAKDLSYVSRKRFSPKDIAKQTGISADEIPVGMRFEFHVYRDVQEVPSKKKLRRRK